MIETIIQLGLTIGFFATCAGGVCVFLVVAWPNFSIRRIKENYTLQPHESWKRINDDLIAG